MSNITPYGLSVLRSIRNGKMRAFHFNPGALWKLKRDGYIQYLSKTDGSWVEITDAGKDACV